MSGVGSGVGSQDVNATAANKAAAKIPNFFIIIRILIVNK
jgi:hypothetical protein